MKVLHVLHELKYSGAEIMYVDAASVFQEYGCELSVLATAKNVGEFAPNFEKAGYTLFHKDAGNKRNILTRLKYLIWVIHFLKKERFDIVHIHSSGMRLLFSFACFCVSMKSVYTFHAIFDSNWYSYRYHIFQRFLCKEIFGTKFQTISDSVYKHELEYYKNSTTLIYNWYGSNRFYPADKNEKTKVREELGIAKDALILISVGGCRNIKRHTHIIKALSKVVKQYPNLIYLHLGEGSDTDSEQLLVKSLGLDRYVKFLGNQSDVRKFLVTSDLYLMTSKNEGISITTIEAMACEIPCILYDVPGLRDFNTNEETSLLTILTIQI